MGSLVGESTHTPNSLNGASMAAPQLRTVRFSLSKTDDGTLQCRCELLAGKTVPTRVVDFSFSPDLDNVEDVRGVVT